jgi:hypothetical protein
VKKRNNFKYKNQKSFTDIIIDKINSVFTVKSKDVVYNAVHEITESDYKYLYRNLVKINEAMNTFADITLNKNKFDGDMRYFVVIRLMATHNE